MPDAQIDRSKCTMNTRLRPANAHQAAVRLQARPDGATAGTSAGRVRRVTCPSQILGGCSDSAYFVLFRAVARPRIPSRLLRRRPGRRRPPPAHRCAAECHQQVNIRRRDAGMHRGGMPGMCATRQCRRRQETTRYRSGYSPAMGHVPRHSSAQVLCSIIPASI